MLDSEIFVWLLFIYSLRFYVPSDIKIGHFRDVLISQSLGLLLKNENKHNKSKHASITKYTTIQN